MAVWQKKGIEQYPIPHIFLDRVLRTLEVRDTRNQRSWWKVSFFYPFSFTPTGKRKLSGRNNQMLLKDVQKRLVRIPDGDGGTHTHPLNAGDNPATDPTVLGGDGGTPTPPAADNGNGTGTLTQQQVNELMGKTRDQARETGRKSALEELGFTSFDEAKAAFDKWKAAEDADKTELQKAQERLQQLSGIEETSTTQAAQIEALNTAVSGQVEALKKTLNIPDYVVSLLDEMTPVQQLEYITNHQESFNQQAKPQKPNINAGNGSGDTPPIDPKKREEKLAKRMPSIRRR